MKFWKLVAVVALLGFLNGMISPENPLHAWRRVAVHVGHTAIALARVSLSTGDVFVTRLWEPALENYHYTIRGTAARIRSATESRRATIAHAAAKATDHNNGRFSKTPSPIPLMSNSGTIREASSEKPQRDSRPRYGSGLAKNRIRQSTILAPNQDDRPHFSGIQLFGNLLSVNVKHTSPRAVLKSIGTICGIKISGQDILPEKLISARFDHVEVPDAIGRLMRISGIKNYALSYVDDVQGHSHATQLVLFPEGGESPLNYRMAIATEPPDQERLEGTIKLLRKRSGRMFIEQGSGPDVLVFTRRDTNIVRNGAPVNFAALRVGDYVEIQRAAGSRAAVDILATSA
jgi:hypothetical protein